MKAVKRKSNLNVSEQIFETLEYKAASDRNIVVGMTIEIFHPFIHQEYKMKHVIIKC